MSEKRLTYDILFNNYYQIREVDDNGYCRRLSPTGIIDLLNEQQATISALKEENIELKKLKKYCAEWMGVKEENLYDVVR